MIGPKYYGYVRKLHFNSQGVADNQRLAFYAGNGKVLEFRGTDYGCVETELASRTFKRWGMIKGVNYGGAAKVPTAPVLTAKAPTAPVIQKRVLITGGSVNIRSKPDSGGEIVAIAHKGEIYTLVGVAPNGWYEVEKPGWFISDRTDLTKLI